MASTPARKKIVVTGPESSGKTAIAAALAGALDCSLSPEFARYYLAHLGRPYQRADLETIGRGQHLWENWYARQHPEIVVCDTDWTVLHVWETFKYCGDLWAQEDFFWQKGYGEAAPADLYLLCAPDFPWSPDPLREHPEQREELFGWYERLLEQYRLPVVVLRGVPEQRAQTALQAIAKLS